MIRRRIYITILYTQHRECACLRVRTEREHARVCTRFLI